jgi:preprotein translocase subunit SecE
MNAFFQELIQTGLYKRSQGRITRQVTFAAMAIIVALGLWRLSLELEMAPWAKGLNVYRFHYWLPGLLLLAGLWVCYRIVNIPKFADFLIAVEAEMNKVSWPSRAELFRASIVVLLTIFALAVLLAFFDFFWQYFFRSLGIL